MLTTKQLEHIKSLQHVCEKADQIKLKLNWDMLEKRESPEVTDFFYYDEEKLVGFLALYSFGNKVELCGMVHPDYRRKGIFTQLFKKGIEEVKKQNFSTILLNTPSNSESGKAFLKTVPCIYFNTEYQMKWEPCELNFSKEVRIRPSETEEDFDAEVMLDVYAFGFEKSEAISHNNQVHKGGTEGLYIIEYEGEIAGKIRVAYEDNESWIYGFAIFPEMQGKGIGRKALELVLQMESSKGYSIFLDVDSENPRDLHLYKSCGFQVVQGQDYYKYIA